jgi:hypothetical protein
MVTYEAQYLMRHGIPRDMVSHAAWYHTCHGTDKSIADAHTDADGTAMKSSMDELLFVPPLSEKSVLITTLVAFTRTVITVTRTVITVTRTVVAVTRTVIAVTRTVVAVTRTVVAVTRTIIAVTRTIIAVTRNVVAVTSTVIGRAGVSQLRTTTVLRRSFSPSPTSAGWLISCQLCM